MNSLRTYLDYNATAPLLPVAREAMIAALGLVGNPSSVHGEGRKARNVVETAREQVARLIGAKPSEVVFTSGAAEANAPVMAGGWSHIAASRIEHETVLAGLARRDVEVIELPVGMDGRVMLEQSAAVLASSPSPAGKVGRKLLTLQFANNETGVIQPVIEAAALAREHGMAVHCDAVQGVGRLPIELAALGVDFMSLTAHKIGGPKGIGALVVREGMSLPVLIPGGQEQRRRGGTEPVAAIAGFGVAAEAAGRGLADMARLGALRDKLEAEIQRIVPAVVIIGDGVSRLPNTSCLSLPGTRAETLVIRLDLMGIASSAGAACSSGKVGASHVLAAMGLDANVARGAIRLSLGHSTTAADIDIFLAAITEIVEPHTRGLARGMTLGG